MSNKVVTGKVRMSYANVWEPKSINGSAPKYSVSLIIPKSDTKTLEDVKKAIEVAKKDGLAKLGGKVPANLKVPIRDGDVDRPDDPAYADSYFINANSSQKPGVVDKKVQPILDQSEFYSGCYGRASISLFVYNAQGNKGISAWLNSVQKLEDGEPLGGSSRPEDDFIAVEDDDILS